MSALNVVSGRVTNPSTTLTALTADAGDSFTVKSFPFGQHAYILNMWAQEATAGIYRIRSPRLHDVAQGIRVRTVAAVSRNLLPYDARQPLQPQDTLTVEATGGAAETDAFSFLVYYADLPGSTQHLLNFQEVLARTVNIAGCEIAVTSGATAGQYSGSTALNATFDNFKRNVDYAWLGALIDTNACTIGVTGPDTGQVRIGMPGGTEAGFTRNYWIDLDKTSPEPMIPVINAANIGATTVDVVATQTAQAFNITLILAELRGAGSASLV